MDLVQWAKILAIFPTAVEHPQTKTFFFPFSTLQTTVVKVARHRGGTFFFGGNILTLLVPQQHEYFSSQLGTTNSFHKHRVSSNPELPVSVLNENERGEEIIWQI